MVRQTIELGLNGLYWVEAEIADIRENRGNCYMELIQKEEGGNTPVARASAKCWRNVWAFIQPHFLRIAGQAMHAGMKVLLQVHAQFHEAYGFSWIVEDVDPTFTLGDMARRRMEIIRQLKEEGVFNLNKELYIPLFAQRIAVISSSTAAGYGDFCNQLDTNARRFAFSTTLFPAIMQGEGVEQSIVAALNAINERLDDFDVVVIIRGGGATSDLSGFDTLALAENVANFPLPVITGIGHERDESILDMVSHTRVKTPTAAAAFLIDNLEQVYSRLSKASDTVAACVARRINTEQMHIGYLQKRLPTLFSLVKSRQELRLQSLNARMAAAAQGSIQRSRHALQLLNNAICPAIERHLQARHYRLQMVGERLRSLNPELLLKRGYSITLLQGRAVKNASTLSPGQEVETRVWKGRFTARIVNTFNNKEK